MAASQRKVKPEPADSPFTPLQETRGLHKGLHGGFIFSKLVLKKHHRVLEASLRCLHQ